MEIDAGVIGLGRIGWQFHCPALARHPEFRLVGVADAAPERCSEAQQTYGCPAFGDYRELLEVPGLSLVVVAAPTHLHHRMTLEALARGLHVYAEKPLASNARQAAEMVRAAAEAGRVLSVYQPHRAAAETQQLLGILRSGEIGQVYQVRCGRFACGRRDDWQSLRRYGGGMLNNYGAHYLDLLLYLLGPQVRRVFCQLRRVMSLGDAEDVVRVVLESASGAIGEVDINQASAIAPFDLQAVGTHGAVVLEGGSFRIRSFSPSELEPKELNRSLASPGRQYPRDQIPFRERQVAVDPGLQVDVYADLARAMRTGSPPFVRPEEPLAVMRLIERCRRSSEGVVASPA
ncbi:MAG: Gfo/Idh/MocA family oxidoreductase [Candidatus Latescibacterota bacterium]